MAPPGRRGCRGTPRLTPDRPQPSLAQTGRWLVGRGQVPEADLKDVPKEFTSAELLRWSMTSDTPVGRLRHLGPVLRLSETPPRWARPSVPLGYNAPVWPERTA